MAGSAMAVPANSAPADGATVTTSTPLFSWSDPTPSLVPPVDHYQVLVDNAANCATANAATFSCTASPALADGGHTWQVQSMDALNQASPGEISTVTNVTVDTTPPAAFALQGPPDASHTPNPTPSLSSAVT